MTNGISCGVINTSKTWEGVKSVGTGTVDMLTFGNSDSVFKAAEWLGGKLWVDFLGLVTGYGKVLNS